MINLELLFKNTTKYSKNSYNTFLNFHAKNFSFRYHLSSILGTICILFLVILYICYHYYELAFISCAVLIIFILWRYFYPIAEVRNEYQSDRITKQETVTYCFYKRRFKIYSNGKFSYKRYKELYKIFETDSFFYLYLDSRHSLLLDKSGFSKGSSKAFREFIKKKCPFRYQYKQEISK